MIIADNIFPKPHDCKLLIIYNNKRTIWDEKSDISIEDTNIESVFFDSFELPFYCKASCLTGGNAVLSCSKSNRIISAKNSNGSITRFGYNLFAETETILSKGQPLKYGSTPSIDLHISFLKNTIIEAGVTLIEIPPVPSGFSFFGCLTHDVDYIGIRTHALDHSVAGFFYRAIPKSIIFFFKRRITLSILIRNLFAALSLPLVYLGIKKDFWTQFKWFIENEKEFPSTYFLSPFKNKAGDKNQSRMRAMRYQASDISDIITELQANGDEIGVHGIDSWHDEHKGKEELKQITSLTGYSSAGIRVHWLCSFEDTPKIIEAAGYDYDSTTGYNEIPGFKAGTFQPHIPPGCSSLLEIPMHIQDCTLFYPERMNLTEKEVYPVFDKFIKLCSNMGGVLTCLWHQRSPGPERNWGNAYKFLIMKIKNSNGYFATCMQIAKWFRIRRQIQFNHIIENEKSILIQFGNFKTESVPPMLLRVYKKSKLAFEVPLTKNAYELYLN
ncbi:MAG TPA: hypothetical protein VKY57_09470 [Chitinispirillaceae bacterium]|nr:hypothetical protein [Chitinispirillaceae bacterium]